MASIVIHPAPSTLKSKTQRQCIVVISDLKSFEHKTLLCYGTSKQLLRDYSKLFPECQIAIYSLSCFHHPLY